jgi:hypothetical protein
LGQDIGWKLVKFSSQLCEAAEPARLLPPYGVLLKNMVSAGGDVAVASEGDVFVYAPQLRRDLKSLHEFCRAPPVNPCYVSSGEEER